MVEEKIRVLTDRLLLREMTDGDLDFIAAMLMDPDVMRFYPKRLTRSEASDWLKRQQDRYSKHGYGLWLAVSRDGLGPVGQVGLAMQEVEGTSRPEIGYLIHRPFWRQGFASEAAAGVRRFAFEELDLDAVISLIRPENRPSQAVARKIGMTPVREVEFKGIRHFLFELTRREADSQ